MKIQNLPLDAIKPYPKNPRDNSRAIAAVAQSIKDFGFNQPIVVDKKMVIVAGHTRYYAGEDLALPTVPVYVAEHLSAAKAKAYRIADNRTNENADWLEELLADEMASMTPKQRKSTAFSDDEIEGLLDAVGEVVPIEGRVEFSEELLESRNYVVLYFDNDVDWLSARTHFKLKSVHSKRCNGKPWSKGIGRVVDGAKYLRRITKNG